MHLADKMRQLIPILRKEGVNEVCLPDIKPECESEWSEKYAIVQDAYADPDYHFYSDTAAAEFRYDLEQFVKNFFGPGVTVKFYQCHEIEVIANGA
jgi:hypothetical protein